MDYKASPIGHEISAVFQGVNEIKLDNCEYLTKTLEEALREDEFTILETVKHKFEPRGFSVVIIISESDATIHTYPEYNSLVFRIYTCRRENDGRKTLQYLIDKLSPEKVELHEHSVIVDQKFKTS
ncbi:adenosylmethionine decarboxylase [Candidatus Pacearchaeota archaeon]|nr:adenosylmethionine decarboxylase [Candidatus Pacearchaeota archaeon]